MKNKENSGVLFVNDYKKDRGPDYRGAALINGVEYVLAAWNRTSNTSKDLISIAFTPKAEADAWKRPASRAPTASSVRPRAEPDDSDIPF